MAKKKLTLQEKLAKRKFKRPSVLGHWFYHLIMVDLKLKKHNPEIKYIDDIRKEKGACFVLWNHLSRLDHSFICKTTYPKRFNMVAAYNEFFRSHLAFVFKLQNILPKKNFCVDTFGMKVMLSMAKKGAMISLAPEGLATTSGYNERILPGLGKLIKHCKIPVYFCKFEGENLAAPSFSEYYRYGGKTCVTVSKMFTPEKLAEYSETEIENIIQASMAHDDGAWQKEHHYKWKTNGHGCNHMEDVCYKCPVCGKEFETEGIGDDLICHSCGTKFHLNEYLEFEPSVKKENLPTNLSEWYLWERSEVIREIRENPNYSVTVKTLIGNLPTDHLVKGIDRSAEYNGEGDFTLDHNGIHFTGTNFGKPFSFDLSYEQYFRLIPNINTRKFSIYINGEYFEFAPERKIAGKLDLITQEMNRLHFDSWKPLPEHEYLYKPYQK